MHELKVTHGQIFPIWEAFDPFTSNRMLKVFATHLERKQGVAKAIVEPVKTLTGFTMLDVTLYFKTEAEAVQWKLTYL